MGCVRMNYRARQKRLAGELRRARVDALLITHLPNIRYLCGLTGSASALLVGAGERGLAQSSIPTSAITHQVLPAKVSYSGPANARTGPG
jgi:Xaa-Pro aminopeptidase